MNTRNHWTSRLPAPRRNKTRSDGLLIVLAIGALLLGSLLMPRSPRQPIDRDAMDTAALAPMVIASTAPTPQAPD